MEALVTDLLRSVIGQDNLSSQELQIPIKKETRKWENFVRKRQQLTAVRWQVTSVEEIFDTNCSARGLHLVCVHSHDATALTATRETPAGLSTKAT